MRQNCVEMMVLSFHTALFSISACLFFTQNVVQAFKIIVVGHFFEIWQGDWQNQTIETEGAYASSEMSPHMHVLLVFIRFVAEFIAVSFAICCKIVMSKYNLLNSASITHSSIFTGNVLTPVIHR